MSFSRLYIKELRSELSSMLILAGLLIVGWLWLYSRPWISAEIHMAMMGISLAIIPLYGILRTFQNLRAEWREDTVLWLKSLPISGKAILGAKTLAVLTELAVLIVLVLILAWPALRAVAVPWQDIRQDFFLVISLGAVGYVSFLPTIFAAYLASQSTVLNSALAGIGVFLGANYLWTRSGDAASRWLPPLRIAARSMQISPDSFQTTPAVVNLAPLIGHVTIGIVLFLLAAYLWDRRVNA